MDRAAPSGLSSVALALLLASCAPGDFVLSSSGSAAPGPLEAPALLPVASGEDPSLEIRPVGVWPPPPEPAPQEPAPTAPRSLSGVRAGVACVGRAGWTASARASAFYERRLVGKTWLSLVLDIGHEQDDVVSSDLFVVRAHAGMAGYLREERDKPLRPRYALGLTYEFVHIGAEDTSLGRFAVAGSLGLELGPSRRKWYVLLDCLLLVGKSAVEGEGFLGLSMHF